MKKPNLHNELIMTGASKREADELTKLAKYLQSSNSVVPALRADAKDRIWQKIASEQAENSTKFNIFSGLVTAGAMASFVGLIIVAQGALPGGKLYALKRGTEKAIVFISPSFRKDLVKRRQDEVLELERQSASQGAVNRAKSELEKSKEDLNKFESSKKSGTSQASDDKLIDDPKSNDSTIKQEDNLNPASEPKVSGSTPGGSTTTTTNTSSGSTSGGGSNSNSGGGSGGHSADDPKL